MEEGPSRVAAILDMLGKANARVSETIVRQPNLESLFLKLTGSELRS
jgi:ABC-2 type transport system ATP-binding protein